MTRLQLILSAIALLLAFHNINAQSEASEEEEIDRQAIARVTDDIKNPEVANLLSMKAGAMIHSTSFSIDSSDFAVSNIINDSIGLEAAWRVKNRKDGDANWVVIELPEAVDITTFSVNTKSLAEEKFNGITARKVSFFISNTSHVEGYKRVATEFLDRGKDHQIVSIEASKGRWVKITLDNNWKHPFFTEIGRVYAYNDVMLNEYEMILQAEGKLDVSDIHFEVGSDALMKKSLPIIETIAEILVEHPEWSFFVEGHTDKTGNAKANLDLSRRRAKKVVALLTSAGIEASRLTPKGYGSSQPLVEGEDDESLAANRRVTFRLKESK